MLEAALVNLRPCLQQNGMQKQMVLRTCAQSDDDSSSNATQSSHAATRRTAPVHSHSAVLADVAFLACRASRSDLPCLDLSVWTRAVLKSISPGLGL